MVSQPTSHFHYLPLLGYAMLRPFTVWSNLPRYIINLKLLSTLQTELKKMFTLCVMMCHGSPARVWFLAPTQLFLRSGCKEVDHGRSMSCHDILRVEHPRAVMVHLPGAKQRVGLTSGGSAKNNWGRRRKAGVLVVKHLLWLGSRWK